MWGTTPTRPSSTSSSRSSRSRPTPSRSGRRAPSSPSASPSGRSATCCRTTTPRSSRPRSPSSPRCTAGRYEFGALRGHGWIPPKAGVPVIESRDRYEESLDILFKALEEERFSYDGQFYKIDDSHIVPRPTSSFRVFARRHERPDVRARGRARLGDRRAAAPALRGAEGPARPLPDEVRRARNDPGHRLDPCLLPRRRPRHGASRGRAGHEELPRRQRLAADRGRQAASRRGDERCRLRLLPRRDPRAARRHALRRDDRRRHRLGRHARRRDRAHRGGPRRLRGPHRGLDHRQPGRLRPLAGDQGAGAVRGQGDAALPPGSSGAEPSLPDGRPSARWWPMLVCAAGLAWLRSIASSVGERSGTMGPHAR